MTLIFKLLEIIPFTQEFAGLYLTDKYTNQVGPTDHHWKISHMYQQTKLPGQGQKIAVQADNYLNAPTEPIISFIDGNRTAADITPVMLKVVDVAVANA